MTSTFSGLELGKRALMTQQKSLEVTGHNISNANNEDYSRQRAIQTATDPFPYPALNNSTGAGQVGTGVQVSKIERVRDEFVDKRFRNENQELGKWSIKKDNLQEIETIFNELEKGGLVNTMNEFWSSFQELNNNPESLSVRESVVQKSITMTTQFNHFDKQLGTLRNSLGNEIEGRVQEFNALTDRIASLNSQIKIIESDTSKQANDLMDKRDKLLDDLSKLADVQYKKDNTNQVNVNLNGISIVQGKSQNELNYSKQVNNITSTDGETYNNVEYYQFSVGGNRTQIDSGEIAGLKEVRGDYAVENGNAAGIMDYKINKLDHLARKLSSQVNNIHQSGEGLNGTTGIDFFEFDPAPTAGNPGEGADLEVNQNIVDDPAQIAASNNGDAGDGSNALEIAQLKDKTSAIGWDRFSEYWDAQSSNLGISIEKEGRKKKKKKVLTDNLTQQREEKSGVSLDEEMSKMVKFQHGYNAAAKVITTLDELYQTLTGIVR